VLNRQRFTVHPDHQHGPPTWIGQDGGRAATSPSVDAGGEYLIRTPPHTGLLEDVGQQHASEIGGRDVRTTNFIGHAGHRHGALNQFARFQIRPVQRELAVDHPVDP